jgi:transposase
MPRRYPPEFRRKVLDLIAADLDVSAQAIYNWRRQERIDRGELAGMTSSEHGELGAARRRIAELESELAATRRVNELLKGAVRPKGASRRSG